MADRLLTLKVIIKQIAAKRHLRDVHAETDFSGQNGSGLHIHQSLFRRTAKTRFTTRRILIFFLLSQKRISPVFSST